MVKEINLEELAKKYSFVRSPNLSRATRHGVLAEEVVAEICKKGKAVSRKVKGGESTFYYTRGFFALDYFPKYDVYLYTSSHSPWSFGNTFYAKSEKSYKKFWEEVVKPVTEKLWK